MAINWDNIKEQALERGRESTVPQPKKTLTSTKSTKKTTSKKTSSQKRKTNTTHNKHKLDAGAKAYQEEQFKTKAVPQAILRANEKVLKDIVLAPVTIPYQIATGKELFNAGLYPETEEAQWGAAAGNLIGSAIEYGTGYKAAGKLIGKGAKAVLGSKAGAKATAKIAASKYGQKRGAEKVTENLLKHTRNVVGDLTVGKVLDISDARGMGLEGTDLLEALGKQDLMNLGVGGAIEFGAAGVRALKNTKLGRQVAETLSRLRGTTDAATGAAKGVQSPFPDPSDFNRKTAADIKDEYLNDIAEKIKKADAKASGEGRRTQTNKGQAARNAAEKNAAKAESQELFDEYMRVQNMTPEEFAGYTNAKANVTPKAEGKVPNEDLTPEAKQRVYDTVEKRSGVKIIEEDLGDIDGYYDGNGNIHVNKNSAAPQYTVLKHELTHAMQTSDMYDSFSKFIFDNMEEMGYDLNTLRAQKKLGYQKYGVDLDDVGVDQELISEFCGEYLFNSEKSIERLARENPSLFRRIYDWIVDTINKLKSESDEAKFLIDAQRKYEKLLKTADVNTKGDTQYLFTRATAEETTAARKMQTAGATPEEIKKKLNLHEGFKRETEKEGKVWLYEVDDSKAKINHDKLAKGADIREVLDHPELWDRLDSTKGKDRIEGVNEYFANKKKLRSGSRGETEGANIRINKDLTDEETMSALLHETQHAIQNKQQIPRGASKDFYKKKLDDKEFLAMKRIRDGAESTLLSKTKELVEEYKNKTGKKIRFNEKSPDGEECIRVLEAMSRNIEAGRAKLDDDFVDKLNDALLRDSLDFNSADAYMEERAWRAYDNTAGEIEARNVSDRRKMTAEERRNTMPVQKDDNTVYREDYTWLSAPEANVINDKKLRDTSKSLYGEKGNKYLAGNKPRSEVKTEPQAAPKAQSKSAAKEPPKKTLGKAKSVSADAKNPNLGMTYEKAAEMYETYKHGTPKKLAGTGDVSKGADTIIGSDYISDEMRTAVKDNIENYVKTTKSNKVTLDNATAKINEKGLKSSIKDFQDKLAKGNRFNEEDIATGAELIRILDEKGDYETALDITQDLVEMMSQAGRTLQSANIFASMTPYGKVRSIMRTAEKMSDRYGKKITIDESMLRKLFEETDTSKLDKVRKEIQLSMWDQVPVGLGEKLDSIRYTAMLSSPKTHIRNILGNTAMYVGKSMSDAVEAALEKSVFSRRMDKVGAIRNTTALNPFSAEDRALKNKAGELFEGIKDTILNHDVKYIENGNLRPQDSPIFKNKALEGARKFVSGSLEYEDEIFMKLNFKNAFAKICKANGLEVGELTAREIRQFTAYATQQAQAATFRDANAIASAMNRVYRYATDTHNSDAIGKLGKGMLKTTMDATVPFKKTPANVLKQGWRYSPGGFLEGAFRCATAKDADALMKGIEILSNGIVGTPVLIAGAYLAKQGLVNGSLGDYSDKETKYKEMLGEQNYAVTVGDKTITMDWLSPYSMPFFVGVELGTSLEDSEITGTELADALAGITNPFLEMSMLQGLQSLITANYDENAAQTLILNSLNSYVGQFVPSLSRQIAKTIAKTTTTTTAVNDGTVTGRFLSKTAAQFKGKIPGLYELNQPDVDMWGRTETKEDIWDYVRSGFRNIISPSNTSDKNVTFVDRQLLDLYDKLDDDKGSVIPTPAKSSVEYDGEKYRMTDKEFADYKKDLGSYRYKKLEELFTTTDYKRASAEQKAKMVADVYSDANKVAKKNFLINSGKMSEEKYAASQIDSKRANSAISAGKTTATKVYRAKQTIAEAGSPKKGILQAYALLGKYDDETIKASTSAEVSDNTLKEAKQLKAANVGLSEIQKIYVSANADGNSAISKEEAMNYLSKTNYSAAQKRAIFDALMSNPKTHNPY